MQVLVVQSPLDIELLHPAPVVSTCRSNAIMNYRSQGDRGCRQSYETTIPGMWLVDCIGIIVAELFDDLADFVVFLVRTCVSHEPLKPVGFCEQRNQ